MSGSSSSVLNAWRLFVGEAGEHRASGRAGCVAGLLVKEPVGDGSALRQALREALPHVPAPVRVAHLVQPVAQVVWYEAAGSAAAAWKPSDRWARCGEAATQLAQRAPVEWAQALGLVAGRSWGEPREQALGRALERMGTGLAEWSPTLRKQLQRYAGEDLDAVCGHLGGLRRGSRAPWLFAAAEGWPGDLRADRADPWLVLLGVLLERVAWALGCAGGEHAVNVHVIGRQVAPGWGEPERRFLNSELLRSWMERTWGPECRVEGAGARVYFDARCRSHLLDANLDAHLVLAECVAHHAGRALDHGNPALEEVHTDLRAHLHLAAQSGAPERSHVAAGPTLAATLREARARELGAEMFTWEDGAGPRQRSLCRRWAWEQALQWLSV